LYSKACLIWNLLSLDNFSGLKNAESETWVLKENMINKLMIFERKIMRKIFGPTRT
jgi:hypothetical protein